MLTSGRTRVKRDHDYCVKLDLIPLSPDLSLTGTTRLLLSIFFIDKIFWAHYLQPG